VFRSVTRTLASRLFLSYLAVVVVGLLVATEVGRARLCMKASYAMEPPGRWTVARLYSLIMTRHCGVLIPSPNATVAS